MERSAVGRSISRAVKVVGWSAGSGDQAVRMVARAVSRVVNDHIGST